MKRPRDPSPSPAAADPRWVMINCYTCGCGCSWDDGDRVIADAKTVAESRTSTGRRIRVSMGLALPPAWSYLYHDMVGSAPSAVENDDDTGISQVVAAHGDSVLFLTTTDGRADYFMYSAGGGASRYPLLTLLPERHVPPLYESGYKGLLRRGEDDIVVAHLDVPFGDGEPRDTAELCVLHVGGSGSGVWELRRSVPIVQENSGGKVHALRDWWEIVAVIPVGDRYLCWLNYITGFLVCDMEVDTASPPKLRYVRLPADLVGNDDEKYTSGNVDPPNMKHSRNMCAAAAGAVRFVSIDYRSCLRGSSTCKRSHLAFTITTWTLKLRTAEEEPMTWVRDGVLDCHELWALPEYEGLPRVPLEYPVVSADDPDVVCFRVRIDYTGYREDSKVKVWLLEVDTRRKRLRSVLPTTIPHWKADSDNIQAKFHY